MVKMEMVPVESVTWSAGPGGETTAREGAGQASCPLTWAAQCYNDSAGVMVTVLSTTDSV